MTSADAHLMIAFDQVSMWVNAFYGQTAGSALAEMLGACRAVVQQAAASQSPEEQRHCLLRLREVAEAKLEGLADVLLQSRAGTLAAADEMPGSGPTAARGQPESREGRLDPDPEIEELFRRSHRVAAESGWLLSCLRSLIKSCHSERARARTALVSVRELKMFVDRASEGVSAQHV